MQALLPKLRKPDEAKISTRRTNQFGNQNKRYIELKLEPSRLWYARSRIDSRTYRNIDQSCIKTNQGAAIKRRDSRKNRGQGVAIYP